MLTAINTTTAKNMRNERHRNSERYGQTRVTFHQRRSALLTYITHVRRFVLSNPDVAIAGDGGFAMQVSSMKRLRKCINERQNLLCHVYQISFPNSHVGSSLLRNLRLVLGAGHLRTSVIHGTTT